MYTKVLREIIKMMRTMSGHCGDVPPAGHCF